MSKGVIASPQSCSVISSPRIQSIIRPQRPCSVIPRGNPLFSSNLKPISSGLLKSSRINLWSNSVGDSVVTEEANKAALDAFFLGKAVGETLHERIESAVGEFLSIIRRIPAEVVEFQVEVMEKATRAKAKASLEALEGKLISESASLGASTVKDVAETTSAVVGSVISEATDVVDSVISEATDVVDSVISAGSSSVPKPTDVVESVISEATDVVDSIISAASSSVPKIPKIPKPTDKDPFHGFLKD